MDVQKALVHIGACESYKEASALLLSGKVSLNGNRIDAPWQRLKGGYYAYHIKGAGLYRFSVRGGKIGKVKEESR